MQDAKFVIYRLAEYSVGAIQQDAVSDRSYLFHHCRNTAVLLRQSDCFFNPGTFLCLYWLRGK